MATERWFHGGVRGLEPGGKILPPSVTGAKSIADLNTEDDLSDRVARVHRADRVYAARDLMQARMFASLAPVGTKRLGGDLYEVTPDGDVEPDPDWLGSPGGSVCCPSATVVRVVERKVPRPPAHEITAGYLASFGGPR